MKQPQLCSNVVQAYCAREQIIRHTKAWLQNGYRLIAVSSDCLIPPASGKKTNALQVVDLVNSMSVGASFYLSHQGEGGSVSVHSKAHQEHPHLGFHYVQKTTSSLKEKSPVRSVMARASTER